MPRPILGGPFNVNHATPVGHFIQDINSRPRRGWYLKHSDDLMMSLVFERTMSLKIPFLVGGNAGDS